MGIKVIHIQTFLLYKYIYVKKYEKLKKLHKPVIDNELFKEIIISKGKGQLTERSKILLWELSIKIFKPMYYRYNDEDIRYDVYMTGVEELFNKWKTFNDKKYDKAIPFFYEIFKRGIATGCNFIIHRKRRSYMDTMIMVRITDLL